MNKLDTGNVLAIVTLRWGVPILCLSLLLFSDFKAFGVFGIFACVAGIAIKMYFLSPDQEHEEIQRIRYSYIGRMQDEAASAYLSKDWSFHSKLKKEFESLPVKNIGTNEKPVYRYR